MLPCREIIAKLIKGIIFGYFAALGDKASLILHAILSTGIKADANKY